MSAMGIPWGAPEGWTLHPGYATRLCADGTEVRVQMCAQTALGRRYWEVRTWDAAYSRGELVQGEAKVHGTLVVAGDEGREQPEPLLWRMADHAAAQHGGWS